MLGVPSLLATILMIVSFLKLAFIELVTPFFCLGALATALIIMHSNICGEENDELLFQRRQISLWIYCLVSQFMSSTWLSHFIVRIFLLAVPYMRFVLFYDSTMFETHTFQIQAVILQILFIGFLEITLYIHTKVKADFFLKLKIIEQQER